jgi:hypothetical protein
MPTTKPINAGVPISKISKPFMREQLSGSVFALDVFVQERLPGRYELGCSLKGERLKEDERMPVNYLQSNNLRYFFQKNE